MLKLNLIIMKLELKYLAPYLPYKMRFVIDMYEFTEGNCKPEIRYFTMGNDLSMCLNYGKPILRPLSDLTKEIEVDKEKFIPVISLSRLVDNGHNHSDSTYRKSSDYVTVFTDKCDDVETVRFRFTIEGFSIIEREGKVIQFTTYDDIKNKLLEWHFDIFGLIKKGLAIDINTLEK